jgi:sterol desaturase/sphingolipid hydroxylase (fatty acid hydroxylase superfamily)
MTATTTHSQPPPPQASAPPSPSGPVEPPAVPGRARLTRWGFRFGAAALVAAGLAINVATIGVLAVLFVLVVPFERLFPRHEQRLRRSKLGLDVGYLFSSPALGIITLVVIGVAAGLSLMWLPGLALRPLVGSLPPAVQAVLGFLLFDFVAYWAHRFSHEVPFLWRFHSVHHSIETMDWVSPFRVHPVDGLIVAPGIAFLLAAGFSLEVTGALAVLQAVLGIFLHANVRWRLRPLHRLVITPELHHWHHANEPDAINTNYTGFLPLWDQLFGTYFMPADRRPERYGIDAHMPPTMLAQIAHPFRGLDNPVWKLRHPIQGARKTARDLRRGAGQLRDSARSHRTPASA